MTQIGKKQASDHQKHFFQLLVPQVHQAGNNAVFSADAYVLFYARINKSVGSENKNASSVASSANHTNKVLNSQNKVWISFIYS